MKRGIAAAWLAAGMMACGMPQGASRDEAEPPEDALPHFESVEQARQAPGVVLVDFYADWCPPCKVQSPVVAKVGRRIGGTASVAKVDVDEQPDLAREFQIEVLPTLIVLKDGQEARRLLGLHDDVDELVALLEETAGAEQGS